MYPDNVHFSKFMRLCSYQHHSIHQHAVMIPILINHIQWSKVNAFYTVSQNIFWTTNIFPIFPKLSTPIPLPHTHIPRPQKTGSCFTFLFFLFFLKRCSSHAAGATTMSLYSIIALLKRPLHEGAAGVAGPTLTGETAPGPGLGWGRRQGPGYVFLYWEESINLFFKG